ncbi:leucine-rich repeat protein [Capnocytophaga leadbetteri]|uniref:leucine-rich repeat protein n=1 Tax=Capnocytophaga leadbetteri TaxID=327575 RepID=UPI0028E68CEC|nr:leucine-rich repeat protein [Capnocytophaga leadbetteri]
MKRILFIAMLGGIGFTTVQCTKTIEERVEVVRERGNAILSGNGVPDASLGKVGDYYLDLSGVNLYGAKTAEGWGNPISLRGLKGDKGNDGQNGTDAPVPNIKGGYWYIGETNTGIKAEGKDGSNGSNGSNGTNGKDGKDGKDGITPTISADGYWVVNGQKTDIKAKGTDGTNGQNGSNGTNGKDGKDGKDGITPTISADGYWVVNGQKTDIKAKGTDGTNGKDGKDGTNGKDGKDGTNGKDGKDGKDGVTPTITINSEGYWVINGQTSTTKAKGEDGKEGKKGDKGADGAKGQDGKDGKTPHIGDNGNWWIGDKDTNIKAQGLKGDPGATGAQGEKGERGLPGKDGSVIYADKGKPTTQGKDGDYYIDTEAKIFYGPKANDSWPTTGISLTNESINNSDYELSEDGKTLIKWLNPKTHYIDMNTDPKLKEVETISKDAFNAEKNNLAYELRTFIIGDKVKEIQTYAFYQCLRLTSVELSNENITRNITKIATLTFGNCTHLQNVDIPASVTTIETRAFIGCDRLTSIILPDKVNSIAANAFMKCKNLHTVIIQNPQAFSISTTAFNQTLLRNIYVPNGKADAYKAVNNKYKDIIR